MAHESPYHMTPIMTRGMTPATTPSLHGTPTTANFDPEISEKMGIIQAAIAREENMDSHFDPDVEGAEVSERPFLLLHACVIGFAATLVVFVEMLCVSKVN